MLRGLGIFRPRAAIPNAIIHPETGELNQRIRDVEQGPDGLLYVTTDHEAGQC